MDSRHTARADLISALVWLGLSAGIFYLSWTMDRLENQHINPFTVPGLVPGILGLCLGAMALMLLVRALRQGALRKRAPDAPAGDEMSAGRLALMLVLCLGFAAGLVGRGLPFWLSTLVFVATVIFLFQLPARRVAGTLARGAAVAVICGAATAAAVTIVFQEIFLVRLP